MSDVPYWRWLPLAACFAIAAAIGFGLRLDAKGFTGNLLAEIVGTLGSVLLAVLLVDRLVAADRRVRWNRVVSETRDSATFSIVQASLALYLELPAPRSPAMDPFIADAEGRLNESLQALAEGLREESSSLSMSEPDVEALVARVAPVSRHISAVVLPRLLFIGDAPELTRSTIALERSVATLEYDLWMIEVFGLLRSKVYLELAEIADAFAGLAIAFETLESDRT